MTNSTTTSTRPVVKSMKPELYVQHTFHMQRARKYTYNYSVSDDYILQNWRTSTITAIANDLNEYTHRIAYRVQILKAVGLIEQKRVRRSPKLLKRRKLLVTWLKEIDTKLEGVA
tara:strand:- start:66 stop:410 length:345 start_codon:yes stop_codon:yes gene_type:complete